MKRSHRDVIVVGGGPAGGTAAYELARRGVNVLVLEKERLPRYKTCAGGVPVKTVNLLDMDLSPAYQMAVTKGKCTYRGSSPVLMDFGKIVGWTVMREEFDLLILQRAVEVGAQVADGQMVREVEIHCDEGLVRTSTDRYSSTVVVGADGANGVVARCSGLVRRPRNAIAVEAEIRVGQDRLERRRGYVHFDFGYAPRGYGWVFPKKEHLSVGLGVFRGKTARLKALLFDFLRRLGLPADPAEVSVRGQLVPLGGVDRVLHRGPVLLAGDAASLAEPMTGEGIYYAVKSAKLAAGAIYDMLEGDAPDLSPYTARVNEQITSELKYANRLAALLYRLPRLSYHFFVRNPLVRWGIADVLCGDLTFEQFFYGLLRSSPMILWTGLRWRAPPSEMLAESRRRP